MLVRIRADGSPVHGARVHMYRPNPGANALGVEHLADVVDFEFSDRWGVARLRPETDELAGLTEVILCAEADGYVSARVVISVPAAEATIDLQRGLRVTGVVATSAGRPVPGLRLRCLPWQEDGLRIRDSVGGEYSSRVREATTDSRGAFTIEGLLPGRHSLRTKDPGTRLRSPAETASGVPQPGVGLRVLAGGPELSLVAEALGIIYLRAIDDVSGKRLFPIALPDNVQFRLAGRRAQSLQREPFELGLGGLASLRGPYDDEIGAMLAVVVADGEQELLAGADAFVELDGFLPVQQRFAVTIPGKLPLGRQVNEVRVRSEHDLGALACRVQARQPPPPLGAYRGPSRIGRLTTASGAVVVRRGQWAPPGEWWFDGLPAGEGTFDVGDDWGNRSQPVSVTLSPDRPAEIDLSYAGPASFAVQVVDRQGREHCGLALGCTPLDPPGPGTGLIEAMAWPSFDQEGKVQRRCMQLPPGEYHFDASSYEVGAGTTIVRLEADTHTLVRIVLTAPPSALSLPR